MGYIIGYVMLYQATYYVIYQAIQYYIGLYKNQISNMVYNRLYNRQYGRLYIVMRSLVKKKYHRKKTPSTSTLFFFYIGLRSIWEDFQTFYLLFVFSQNTKTLINVNLQSYCSESFPFLEGFGRCGVCIYSYLQFSTSALLTQCLAIL